jgi:arsenical-resistance protein
LLRPRNGAKGGLLRMSVTIYHNPACGTSRNTLALIRATGVDPKVVEYLTTPPSREGLVSLIGRMGIGTRDLLRQKGTPYADLKLDDLSLSDEALIDAMLEHTTLINRPIVVGPRGAKLCRPSELVLAGLAVLFFEFVFADLIAPGDAQQYIAGLILLGAAPCTAMVFVWSQMTRGDPAYTLVQVSVNDIIMVFAFAPIVALLLGVTDIAVPWETLLLSTILYVVIPLAAGAVTRRHLLSRSGGNAEVVARFTAGLKPLSFIGLLLTVVLLFGFQGQVIVSQPLLIGLIAVPIIIQSYGIFLITYAAAWARRVPHPIAAPCALIGTSNFFELAVAVAIGLFGLGSGAALATVVGVLVEVPVMLSLVAIAKHR